MHLVRVACNDIHPTMMRRHDRKEGDTEKDRRRRNEEKESGEKEREKERAGSSHVTRAVHNRQVPHPVLHIEQRAEARDAERRHPVHEVCAPVQPREGGAEEERRDREALPAQTAVPVNRRCEQKVCEQAEAPRRVEPILAPEFN